MALFSNIAGGDLATMQAQLDEQRATEVANLTPNQIYQQMAYKAGSGLTRGIGGLLGADMVDPELKRKSLRARIVGEINPEDEESLKEGVTKLQQAGFAEDAFALSAKLLERQKKVAEIDSEKALAAQRSREKEAADPFQKLVEVGKYKTSSLKKYKQSGNVGDLEFKDSDAKTQVVDTVDGQLLINSETGAIIANIGKKPTKPSIGSDIAAGLGPIMGAIAKGQATKSGESSGTAVGKDVAAIQGKYTALSSIDDALNVVKKGIYAGGYGPLEEALAKYSKGTLADKQRLINTEEFRSYIGDVVIPRLTEFGGNDSVEELKYLKSVMAGETTMESKSIERILNRAKEKIQAGVKRIEAQQKAIEQGKPLPTGPMGKKTVTKTTRSGLVYEVVEEE